MNSKIINLLLFLLLSLSATAQVKLGVVGALVVPNAEEPYKFKPSPGVGINLYYNTASNIMLGAHLVIPGKNKFNEQWFGGVARGIVTQNNIYLRYSPLASVSIQYLIQPQDAPANIYFGLNLGAYFSSVSGTAKAESGTSSSTIGFHGEEHADFGIAPKVGFIHDFVGNLKIQGELKYDLVFTSFRHHIFTPSLGLIYIFGEGKS